MFPFVNFPLVNFNNYVRSTNYIKFLKQFFLTQIFKILIVFRLNFANERSLIDPISNLKTLSIPSKPLLNFLKILSKKTDLLVLLIGRVQKSWNEFLYKNLRFIASKILFNFKLFKF
ncbi:hypothetical protein EHP00_2599 [Ecytonucleospora hepatopenaei]|uniref:Uncharacterized protein n=1 Tax=Ecytonucleospora hepatopenaei TaxID=646526 RepID=A0A1W0E2C5_9MICR|nr:hypothetical protein EHP00_2599 [Ecytonucleospora hepatopenaei]